jgi:membrane protein
LLLLIAIISHFSEFKYLDMFTNIFNFLNPTHSDEIIDTLKNYISNSDKLGFVGIFYMLFVFIMFFKDYEYIVNKIHKTKRKYIQFIFYIFYSFL